jgi:ankyrin repeat protein
MALVRAAAKGDLDVVASLLSTPNGRAEVNGLDETGVSPLAWASSQGFTGIVELLLKVAEPSYYLHLTTLTCLSRPERKSTERTPMVKLGVCAACCCLSAMLMALSLSWAAGKGHLLVVRMLLDNKAQVDIQDAQGQMALTRAAGSGCLEIVELLLKCKARINNQDSTGASALSWAATRGHLEVVEALLEANANPWICDSKGRTPLHFAAFQGHLHVVQRFAQLPDFAVGVGMLDQAGCSAREHAERAGRREIVLFLGPLRPCEFYGRGNCMHGSRCKFSHANKVSTDPAKALEEGSLPRAAGRGDVELVEALIDAGVEVDSKDSSGATALRWAAKNNRLEVVKVSHVLNN